MSECERCGTLESEVSHLPHEMVILHRAKIINAVVRDVVPVTAGVLLEQLTPLMTGITSVEVSREVEVENWITVKKPAGRWQMFKAAVLPGWVCKLWPVRMRDEKIYRRRRFQLTARRGLHIEVTAAYPKLAAVLPPDQAQAVIQIDVGGAPGTCEVRVTPVEDLGRHGKDDHVCNR